MPFFDFLDAWVCFPNGPVGAGIVQGGLSEDGAVQISSLPEDVVSTENDYSDSHVGREY